MNRYSFSCDSKCQQCREISRAKAMCAAMSILAILVAALAWVK